MADVCRLSFNCGKYGKQKFGTLDFEPTDVEELMKLSKKEIEACGKKHHIFNGKNNKIRNYELLQEEKD